MGVMEVIVDTMPVAVYCIASSVKDTPRNGPKKEPMAMLLIAILFCSEAIIFLHLLPIVITMQKQ